jgi:hypothetical protein
VLDSVVLVIVSLSSVLPQSETDDEGIDLAYHRAQLEGIVLSHHGMVELVMPDASRSWHECRRENAQVGSEICGWRTRLRFETGRRHGGETRERRRGANAESIDASLALEVFDKVGPLARLREEEVGAGRQRLNPQPYTSSGITSPPYASNIHKQPR